ncbi:MAG TPA: AI-2E family transporter, partial [Candidatus Nanopelagicales bacterium]|nr:AI-2E family transporter [Candidatus Nanopelagicales bacterium]
LAISAFLAVVIIMWARAVLLPFILALIVAYVCTPSVLRLVRLGLPRWGAILVVYAIALSAIGGFIALTVPRLIIEGKALTAEAPRYVAQAREQWLPALDARVRRWTGRDTAAPVLPAPADAAGAPVVVVPPRPEPELPPVRVVPRPDGSFDVHLTGDVQLREAQGGVWKLEQDQPRPVLSSATMLQEGFDRVVSFLGENSLTLLKIGQEIASAITRGIFNLFLTLMLAGYLILTHERVIAFFRELWPPPHRESFDRFLRRLDRGLSGVVRGQLLICLVNGVLSAIGFWLFDLKYWPILSILAGVMSLIPIFGSILSSVPAVAIGLTQSPATAFGVLAWIVGIHQLEANFLNPKIIGDSAKIHPVLVVFSLLVGEHYFQIAGALFAVPCLSIAQTIFLHFRESALGLPDPTATIPPPARRSMPTPAPVPLAAVPAVDASVSEPASYRTDVDPTP